MHISFLEHVLDDLRENQYNLTSCVYVLPSKRSGFFLKQYLGKRLNETVFAPQILSIEEFVQDIAGLRKSTSLELIIELYEVYNSVDVKEPLDFASFLKWGNTLIQDFNEIDRYLIPSKEILNYLTAIKEIDHWSLKKDKTELVENYLSLWHRLQNIYEVYTSRLLANKTGYQGLIYKEASKNIQAYAQKKLRAPLVFVGFNALNNAESHIIQYLLDNHSCEIYWDIDNYFLQDSVHDAGLFIRKYLKEWPYYQKHKPKGVHHTFLQPKKIEITGVPKSISQAKYVGTILQHHVGEKTQNLDLTALVLADETLLGSILQALPGSIPEVNITMGIHLGNLVLYSFVESYLEMIDSKNKKGWFYKNVLKFLSNPYSLKLSSYSDIDFARRITEEIISNNSLVLDENYTGKYFVSEDMLQALFPKGTIDSKIAVKHLLFLIERLKKIFQNEKEGLELEYLYHFYKVLNQLQRYLDSVDFIKDIKSIKSILKILSTTEQLDFLGEPLKGLQVMGMLESRNLDFDKVILTSVNEGILPTGKTNNSFIPYDVKREYGLPTYKEKDAIYTYHFYRLIQRAKTIHLIYNTEPDVLEGGEKSRLISQLLTDEKIAPFVHQKIGFPKFTITKENPKSILKTPKLLSDIQSFAIEGFSPTSLTNYIKNPINFYKKSILKLDDPLEVKESIAPNILGTILHDALYLLYLPLVGKTLTDKEIEMLKSKITEVVEKLFHKHLPGVDISRGRFLLVYHVVKKYLNAFLDLEKEKLKHEHIKILALEERYQVVLNLAQLSFPVKIKGIIDRIDECNGVTRVIDYKTGTTTPSEVKFKTIEEVFTNDAKNKAFQLLCYCYLLNKNEGQNPVLSGIFALKNLNNGLLTLAPNTTTLIDDRLLDQFEDGLTNLILEICNPSVPFVEAVG